MEQSTPAANLSRVLRDLTGLDVAPADESAIVEQLSAVRLMATEIEGLVLDWSSVLQPFDPRWPEAER
jgi:hypothetical protein